MVPLPAVLLAVWLVALVGDAAVPAPTYVNERFAYVVVVPQGYERLPATPSAFDLRILDRKRSLLAAFYGVSGPRTDDRAVFAEMQRYLQNQERDKRVLVLEGPQRLDAAGRQGACWSLLRLDDGMLWRLAVLPHDAGGRSAVYLTVILVTDPDAGEQLDAAMARLLRGVRFVPPRKR